MDFKITLVLGSEKYGKPHKSERVKVRPVPTAFFPRCDFMQNLRLISI